MAAELLHTGFGNFVAMNRVLAIATPTSSPILRLVREGKRAGTIKDITQGRRTKAVIFMDDGSIVLAPVTPEALQARASSLQNHVSSR